MNLRVILIVILIVIFCALLGVFLFLVFQLPAQAEAEFGPPAGNLDLISQYNYAFQLYFGREALLSPQIISDVQQFPFEILYGESVSSISYRLFESGYIADADLFQIYLIYSGLDRSIQSGVHTFEYGMNTVQIAQSLQDATPQEIDFVILPGWRLEEIAKSLETSGFSFSPAEFLALCQNPTTEVLPVELSGVNSLEGYLFPGTYTFERDISLTQFLENILDVFLTSVDSNMIAEFEKQSLSLQEAMILASIIEKEAVNDSEAKWIASVFLNRLNVDMKLESDPTVQYSIGFDVESNSWWKNPLTYSDLEYNSLYNTYIMNGLPPGPICNPGLNAIEAVAYPEVSGFYYFRARCDGSGNHNFAETYNEHVNNACE